MEDILELINTCNYNRKVCQYLSIDSKSDSRITLEYCVPFQRALKNEYDFTNIARKYFDDVEVITLPDGMSSGLYQISFNVKNADLIGVKKLTEKLNHESDIELDEINRVEQERRNYKEHLIKQRTEPFRNEISKFQALADETDDKYDYHNYMMKIIGLHKEISRINNSFR